MPICFAIIALQRQGSALLAALRDRGVVLRLATSALLTATNSLIFFIAVVSATCWRPALAITSCR